MFEPRICIASLLIYVVNIIYVDLSNRQQLGQTIAQTFRAVRRVSSILYRVKLQSGNGKYEVRLTTIGWVCK
jgi:hypothetical protein